MITRIKIENYKSIEEVTLDLKGMNAFIGKNGAGKTTFISIFNLLKHLASGDKLEHAVEYIAPLGFDLFNFNRTSNSAKLRITVQAETNLYELAFTISYNDLRGRSFVISEESLTKLGGDRGQLIYRRNNESGTLEVSHGDTIAGLPLKIEGNKLALSSYSNEDARIVAETLSTYTIIWLDSVHRDSEGYSFVRGDNPNLNTIDGVAVDLYKRDPDRFKEAISAIKKIIPDLVEPRIVSLDEAFRDNRVAANIKANNEKKIDNYAVTWSDNTYSRNITRLSLSGGNARVIYLILSLFNTRTKSCFVAEEIENGLHTSRIGKLIDELRTIVKINKIQLIFTTHNYQILDKLLPDEVVFCQLGNKGSTYKRVNETKEYQLIKEQLGSEPTSSDVVNSGLLYD
ncbi:MAG: AAA family ATPase [Candidatus Woesebacteria bacterium]|jgi:predicted ATPase